MTNDRDGFPPASYLLYEHGSARRVENAVVGERQICIYLNGQELATLRCSPYHLDELAVGFLRSERLIESMSDVDILTISESNSCVDVWLKDARVKPPTRRIITSGCGEGVTFDKARTPHWFGEKDTSIEAADVNNLMNELMQVAELYREVGGVHTSALSDGRDLILVAEDMGLNNTVDRLWGKALRQGRETRGCILLCSGRIVSDIIEKGIEMGVPIIISLTSPTSLSIEMASKVNLTLIGYARGDSFRVYSAPERVGYK
jgi:FdhD protein